MNEEKKQDQNQKINQGGHHQNHRHRHHYNNKNKGQNNAPNNNGAQAEKPSQEAVSAEKNNAGSNNLQKQSGHHQKFHHKHHNQQQKKNPAAVPENIEKQKPEGADYVKQENRENGNRSADGDKKHSNRNNRHHNNNKNRSENVVPENAIAQEAPAAAAQSEASFDVSDASTKDYIFGDSLFQREKKPRPTKTYDDTAENVEISDDVLFGTSHLIYSSDEIEGETAEIIGIRYKCGGKAYYFDPDGIQLSNGEFAIVDTARGIEFGEVCIPNSKIKSESLIHPLRKVIRKATKEDIEHHEQNKRKEAEAFNIGLEKIKTHKLDMKLVDVQYEFDNSKLLFYFTSAGRVDFRELVRDLASVFKTRIELRQIGIRDEAKMLGGIGMCGRSLCCSKYLSNFAQVSIKMAKEQGLSLNSNKISGNCGRLMCCLNFENQVYLDEIKITPMPGSVVKIGAQKGTVTEANPLTGMLKIHMNDAPEGENVSAHRDTVTIISRKIPETAPESPSDIEPLEEKN